MLEVGRDGVSDRLVQDLPSLLKEDSDIHPCRKGGPISNKNWKRDHQAMEARLTYAEKYGLEKHKGG